ncbi:DNL zinc finger-domain-containing protein [Spinellus fusiger]|nr:DNL zinc finger-domain-containing protein [Spinellus fusiger]
MVGFTCEVCDQRSNHVMSALSYTKGVVLIQCPGCKNRHLIADNLGWFRDEKVNIEDLAREKGESVRRVLNDDEK